MGLIGGSINSILSGLKHVFVRRMTLRYPDQKLELPGQGYMYDPKKNVGIAGFKGRHILYLDKCTGCQLCSIACEGVAVAIEMVPLEHLKYKQNKKSLWPQIDFGKCVFCGLCVDACPFDALFMTNDYELCGYHKRDLIYTPEQLAVIPKASEGFTQMKISARGAHHG